jgi:pimeloyl-ACP methyl ester carboxylesterase
MGGNVAMLYAGIRAQRMAAVVSLEGFGLRRCSADGAPKRYAGWLDQLREPPAHSSYASVEDLAQKLQRRNPRLGIERARFVAAAWSRPDESRYELCFDPWHRLMNPITYRREEAEACWRSISAPVLSVLGGDSELRKALDANGDTQNFHRALARVTVGDLAGVGHMLHHEAPERVAEVVTRWFVKEGVNS